MNAEHNWIGQTMPGGGLTRIMIGSQPGQMQPVQSGGTLKGHLTLLYPVVLGKA